MRHEMIGRPRMERREGGKMWIQKAIKHPGALHEELGIPEGTKIPVRKLEKAAHSRSPLMRKQANLDMTLQGFHHGRK